MNYIYLLIALGCLLAFLIWLLARIDAGKAVRKQIITIRWHDPQCSGCADCSADDGLHKPRQNRIG